MAKFEGDIQYSQTVPSGEIGAVPMPAGLARTGAPEMMASLTGDMLKVYLQVLDTEKINDNAKSERQYEMARNAAFTALQSPNFDPADEAAVQKIKDQAEKDMTAFQSKFGGVNTETKSRFDRNYAQWDLGFSNEWLKARGVKADDEKVASETHYYETGNKTGFTNLQRHLQQARRQGPEETKAKINDFGNISALHQAKIDVGNGRYQAAIDKIKDLKLDDVKQIDYRDGILADARRLQSQQLKDVQEQTSRTLLADFWDKKLTDPNVITDALRNNWLSDMDAKYLRNVMLNPEPVKTNMNSYIKVKESLQDLAMGTKTKQELLSLITSMTNSLSAEDGKSFIKDVYSEPDKGNTFWEREAYQTIEKRLMTLDPVTGRLFGSTAQINATDRAKIRFDDAIKSAARTGKPLQGNDYLKKAVEIANQLMPKEKQITFGGQTKLPPPTGYEEFIIGSKSREPAFVPPPEPIKLRPELYEDAMAAQKAIQEGASAEMVKKRLFNAYPEDVNDLVKIFGEE